MFSLQASRTRQDGLPASVSRSRSYDTITQDFPDINLPGGGCLQEAWAERVKPCTSTRMIPPGGDLPHCATDNSPNHHHDKE